MTDIEKVIKGLEFTKAMITFNPSTGEDIEPENLNEANKTSYDACVGAISLLKEQEAVVRCKDCKYWLPMNRFHQDYHLGRGDCKLNWWVRDFDWFCADGERKD